MKKWSGILTLLVFYLAGAVWLRGNVKNNWQIEVKAKEGDAPKKVYVCKFVGTPGVDERLQTGDNPLEVSVNAIKVKPVVVGSFFNDKQGRSFVLGYVPMNPAPGLIDCQAKLTPTPTQVPTAAPTNIPTPSPSIEPTSLTPTVPVPTGSTSPTPTASPTEVPVPTATSTPGNENTNPPGNPGTPSCDDPKPGTPSNLIATWISNTQIKLNWQSATEPVSHYLLAYGPAIGNYPWGNPNIGKGNEYIVGALSRGNNYCFYVKAQNNCAGGEPSNTACVNQPVLKRADNNRVLGVKTNFNPLVNGIKNSYGGEVLGATTELLGTDEVIPSQEKLPSGNSIDLNHSIEIPTLGLRENIYKPQKIGDEYTVGSHEVLFDKVNGNNVYYGHNGGDVFGKIYQLKEGAEIVVIHDNQKTNYKVSESLFVHKSVVQSLNSDENQIVLTTCSYTQPEYRIVIKANKI